MNLEVKKMYLLKLRTGIRAVQKDPAVPKLSKKHIYQCTVLEPTWNYTIFGNAKWPLAGLDSLLLVQFLGSRELWRQMWNWL